ncbi:CTD small phosphatase 2 [Olea europaea subsp. europaea]|uniref:CTD small phosphatase 2 n=1 Tax=Olea europaea subsp. europaea TaxID=158383 RepID=A0A8S0SEP3_OLEEU|nr:CTD small phosphatase 2 [Olea europaea subsp. europaea]
MQTKKKITGRSSRELASPRVSRQQKKLSENVQVQPKKVAQLITSSARKKKVVGTLARTIEKPVAGTDLDTKFRLVDDDDSNKCMGYDTDHDFNNAFIDNEGHNGAAHCVAETIFSPAFHLTRNTGGEISSADFFKFFQHGNHQLEDCGEQKIQTDCHDLGGVGLSSEVSAIYLSMRNSNLECIDENNQDHISADVCKEDAEGEEFDDFDPYFFIKNLPDLSSIVPAFRPVLLPKQTRSCPSTTLVLDLDETLVHSTLEPCDDADFTFSVNFDQTEHRVYVRCRPYLRDFLDRVSSLFEIIIFTASQSIYAEQLLNVLDPKRKIFRHRVYRDSCLFVDGNYLKDLSVLGRDLAHVIIIDNSPQVFGFQVDNGIPIESWFEDRSDTELISLLPFLESLVRVEDVRPLIANKYNLRAKIDAAACRLNYTGGDPFDR